MIRHSPPVLHGELGGDHRRRLALDGRPELPAARPLILLHHLDLRERCQQGLNVLISLLFQTDRSETNYQALR